MVQSVAQRTAQMVDPVETRNLAALLASIQTDLQQIMVFCNTHTHAANATVATQQIAALNTQP